MSEPYEEQVEGQKVLRFPPGQRHEVLCARLHDYVTRCLPHQTAARLLASRSPVQIDTQSTLRPDLALVTVATGKLWLAAEIISSDDHRTDTVMKKQVYEDHNIPRLWMVDPRYHNVEVYHGSPYGLTLKSILAGRDVLSEQLLPELRVIIDELFGA
jgi:hypothetical protein